jgi:hypothetical protein
MIKTFSTKELIDELVRRGISVSIENEVEEKPANLRNPEKYKTYRTTGRKTITILMDKK